MNCIARPALFSSLPLLKAIDQRSPDDAGSLSELRPARWFGCSATVYQAHRHDQDASAAVKGSPEQSGESYRTIDWPELL